MKNLYMMVLLSTVLFYSAESAAVVCYNARGTSVVDELNYDLSTSFNSSNNSPGNIVELKRTFSNLVLAKCVPHNTRNPQTKRSYVTTLPILETIGNYKYLKLNDYLSGAMQITDSYAGAFYPPANYVQMGTHYNVPTGEPFMIGDLNFVFRLKVLRPFIDHVVIPKNILFRVYVTTERTDPLQFAVYSISYSGIIDVPQSCEINAGQIINISFNKVSAHSFNQAGVKPESVQPAERQIGIQCKNINAQALLTLRLESERSVDNMMVSNNPNVGFQVATQNGQILRPNDLKSLIKFRLDNAASSKIPLKFWPVSVTGVKPEPGVYTGRGYLRVDYD